MASAVEAAPSSLRKLQSLIKPYSTGRATSVMSAPSNKSYPHVRAKLPPVMRGLAPIFQFLVALVFLFAQPVAIPAQSTNSAATGVSDSGDKFALRARLLSTIPPAIYEKWRKYGQWDYNQIGFSNYDFTQFNFGATGAAAKIDKDSLLALVQAFEPDPTDLHSLVSPDLEPNFKQHADEFEKLLKMAQQDSHMNRIAPDFTWLDTSSKWPREDIGFTNARWDEYRSLFKNLSLTDGIVRTQDFPEALFFLARSNGLCTGGSGAGYVYSPAPLILISASPLEALDAEARKNPSRHYAYVFKPLKTNWYTFYEMDW